MLTPPDGRGDGEFRSYLQRPSRWRPFDPHLYDRLSRLSDPGTERNVSLVSDWDLIPGARYVDSTVPDDRSGRQTFAASTAAALSDCPLLFFDPDNGIEVTSVRMGHKGSSKYVYWNELAAAYSRGKSLVVNQHFRRIQRDAFIASQAHEIRVRLGAADSFGCTTSHVLFWIIPQHTHTLRLQAAARRVALQWRGEITPSSITASETAIESACAPRPVRPRSTPLASSAKSRLSSLLAQQQGQAQAHSSEPTSTRTRPARVRAWRDRACAPLPGELQVRRSS